jgi:hypothetical protein
MTNNVKEFTVTLKNYKDVSIPGFMLRIHRKVTLDLLAALVKKSPVGYPPNWSRPAPKGYVGGQFRSFWQVSLTGDQVKAPTNDKKPYGSDVSERQLVEANATLQDLKPFGVSYVVNGLPYGERLNAGWSRQAPAGFMELSVAEVSNAANRFLEKLDA